MVFSGSAQKDRKPDKTMNGQEDDSSDFTNGGTKVEIKTHTYIFEVHLKLKTETILLFIVTSGFSKIKNMKPDK